MPTQLPRIKVTLDPEVLDRLSSVGAHWGVSVAGLLRCVAERIAEEVQLVDLGPSRGRVYARGGPLPHALLQVLAADREGGRDAFEVAGDILALYGSAGAAPSVTFRPPDLTNEQVLQGWQEVLQRPPTAFPVDGSPVVPFRPRRRRARAEDGATPPPGGPAQAAEGPSGPILTPVGNTGVTLPRGGAPARPKARKVGS